ncbi:MAG: VOC family protein [Verrucomicrobia bacterium]|nr:VOC family protein [Verrucomicrobiota bacterium]
MIDRARSGSKADKPGKESKSLGNNESDKIRLKRLSHAAIGVRDLVRQAEFYANSFGFVALPQRGVQHAAFDLSGRAELSEAIIHLGDGGFKRVGGPGRHGPGNMLFSYFEDPERNLLELCSEIQQIDEASHHSRSWDANTALNLWNTRDRLGPPRGLGWLLPALAMTSRLSRYICRN